MAGWDFGYLIRNGRIRDDGARSEIRRISSSPPELPSGYFFAFDGEARGDLNFATL